MNLSQPVTIQPPTITRSTGEVRVQKPITLSELDITLIDNNKRKRCEVRIRPCPYSLLLWTNNDYDAIGDYTQAQVEAKVLELLGSEPAKVLEGLFLPPAPPVIK
jgi:hypothetical protein